ncbi:MAG: hypothetical protein HY699_07315 [Deltaproteobacteria bacterium]|nr:hypothetical protein [Deltaproteobacteria bacterium]
MRRWLTAILLLGLGGRAMAQTPPPAFSYFKCLCQAGSAALAPTPSLLGPSVSSWRGTAYALSDTDAQIKAKNACLAESHGGWSICDSCRCYK